MDDHLVCYVLGVDPGEATGLAMCGLEHLPDRMPQDWGLLRGFRLTPLATATVPRSEFPHTVRTMLQAAVDPDDRDPPRLAVSCERYIVTRLTQQTQDVQALDVTGQLKAVLGLLDIDHSWASYGPAHVKALWTDERLRNLGMVGGSHVSEHARDALRHALEWSMRYVRGREELRPSAVSQGQN